MTMPENLTTQEVARLFGVEPLTVRKWARLGRLPVNKPGGRLLFPREQVLALYHREGNNGSG